MTAVPLVPDAGDMPAMPGATVKLIEFVGKPPLGVTVICTLPNAVPAGTGKTMALPLQELTGAEIPLKVTTPLP